MSTLRRWFGPSREEIWRQVSNELGGTYVEAGFFKSDRVHARHGEWDVVLDTYTVSTGKVTIVYTRMRAPYVNPDGFRFTIYRKSAFSGLGRMFGMQDVEIGDPAFDTAFIIKGNDEARLRSLFSNPRLKELIAAQPEIKLSVEDDDGWFGAKVPEKVDILTFVVTGVIKDVDRLRGIYELFAETLDQLCRIGSAYEAAPDVRL